MNSQLFVLGLILTVAAVIVALILLSRPTAAAHVSPAQAAAGLRLRALQGTAAQFSIEPVAGVWGVLMETGIRDAAVTLVALGDGSASIYFSSGGGMLGGGPHPSVNAAARRFVEVCVRHVSELSPTTQFPLPDTGSVRFYVLTTDGVLEGGAREEVLLQGDHSLAEMFFAGHDVITRFREVTEQRQP
jgi:hypothetical protein